MHIPPACKIRGIGTANLSESIPAAICHPTVLGILGLVHIVIAIDVVPVQLYQGKADIAFRGLTQRGFHRSCPHWFQTHPTIHWSVNS